MTVIKNTNWNAENLTKVEGDPFLIPGSHKYVKHVLRWVLLHSPGQSAPPPSALTSGVSLPLPLVLLFWLLLPWGPYGSKFPCWFFFLPLSCAVLIRRREDEQEIFKDEWETDAGRNWGGSLSGDHKYWDINSLGLFSSVLMGYQAALLQPFQSHLCFHFAPSSLEHVEEEGHLCLESFTAASTSLSFISLFS